MKLKILSPVHIGSGERKTRMNFIVQNSNQAYFINEDLFNSLVNVHEFINWAGGGGNDIAQFLQNKEQIRKQLIDRADYHLPVYGPITREVYLHIKDASNFFYIPGSSIKGAIRTALLYSVLIETRTDINQLLEGINGTDIRGVLKLNVKRGKWAGQELEKFVFRAGVKKDDKTIISYNDAKYDLLRFIHISDAYPLKAEYGIMPVRVISSASPAEMNLKAMVINAEVICRGEFQFQMEADMKSLLALKDVEDNYEWIDLKPKFRSLFGFDIAELKPDNLRDYEERIISHIMSACRVFYQRKKEADLTLLKGRKIRDGNVIISGTEGLINNYPQVTDGVLQLGFGTGWAGKTAGLYWNEETLSKLRKSFHLGKFKCKIYSLPCRCVIGTYAGTNATNWKKLLSKSGVLKQRNGVLICPKCHKQLDKKKPLQPEIIELIWPFPKTLHIVQWNKEDQWMMVPMGWAELEVV